MDNMQDIFKEEKRYVMLSLPLLLRLFEYINETQVTDEDLHFMAERMQQMMLDNVRMSMNQYSSIIPHEERHKRHEPVLRRPEPILLDEQTFYKTTQVE